MKRQLLMYFVCLSLSACVQQPPSLFSWQPQPHFNPSPLSIESRQSAVSVGVIDSGFHPQEMQINTQVEAHFLSPEKPQHAAAQTQIRYHGNWVAAVLDSATSSPQPQAIEKIYLLGWQQGKEEVNNEAALSSPIMRDLISQKKVKIWNNSYIHVPRKKQDGSKVRLQQGTAEFDAAMSLMTNRMQNLQYYINQQDALFVFATGNHAETQPSLELRYPIWRQQPQQFAKGLLAVGGYNLRNQIILAAAFPLHR